MRRGAGRYRVHRTGDKVPGMAPRDHLWVMLPTAADVIAAGFRLRSLVERTPLERSDALSRRAGADEPLLAGQGTVALEILEELAGVRTLVVPVGSGGLVGGIAALMRAVAPTTRIIGVQSEHTNAMAASLAAGRRTEVDVPPTLA